MANLDRNSKDFDNIIRRINTQRSDHLTVGHAKIFSLCTSNLDPHLRKLVREQRGAEADIEPNLNGMEKGATLKEIVGDAEFLFDDIATWKGIEKPLTKMSTLEVVAFLKKLSIPQDRLEQIIEKFNANNITGLVIQSCDLNELREVLKVSYSLSIIYI